MKAVRWSSVVLAVILVTIAFSPVAAKPAVVSENVIVGIASPVQSFLSAARGLPLLAPLSVPAPSLTVVVENAAAAGGYSCTLVSQSPKDYTKMRSRQYFDASWVIQNTGDRIWHASSVSFQYMGGAKMQTRGSVFDLRENVGLGKKVNFTIDMIAPKARGGYTTLWGLFGGKSAFCRVTLILAVTR